MGFDLKKLITSLRSSDTIITPRWNQYLLSGAYDQPLPKWITELIVEELGKKQRRRSGTFSSSSAGRCLRLQELEFIGAKEHGSIDPQLAHIFLDGKWRHLRWQAHLLNAGIITHIEHALPWPRMHAWSTLDGVGEVPDTHAHTTWRGEEFGLEIKGVNSWGYRASMKDEDMKEAHLNQVHRYFLMSGYRLFVILYENKDTQDWHEWVIEADTARIQAQQDELDAVNADKQNGNLRGRLPECRNFRGPTFNGCKFGGNQRGSCAVYGEAGAFPKNIP